MAPLATFFALFSLVGSPSGGSELESKVREIFEESCTSCHSESDDPNQLNLEQPPGSLVGKASSDTGKALVVPGAPDKSYLMQKLTGASGITGDRMPQGDDPLPKAQLETIAAWIEQVEESDGGAPDTKDREESGRAPFHGTHQVNLHSTTTLGKKTLEFRVHHRFGAIGTERGAFGLDVGAIMSLGLTYGILDGWDVMLRRTNSHKGYELGTKYIPVRQEAGMPFSFGVYASVEWLRDFPANVANPWAGNFQLLFSRLWFDRWSTMLMVGYSLPTNHAPRVYIDDFGNADGPVRVNDRRGTLDIGLASTVWLGKKKRWGIDLEYLLPIPDGRRPNVFYYHGGDADPNGTKIGAWSLGASVRVGLHFFQVFFTNTREIHTNLVAPGGQTGNPFENRGNFFIGFNLSRKWKF